MPTLLSTVHTSSAREAAVGHPDWQEAHSAHVGPLSGDRHELGTRFWSVLRGDWRGRGYHRANSLLRLKEKCVQLQQQLLITEFLQSSCIVKLVSYKISNKKSSNLPELRFLWPCSEGVRPKPCSETVFKDQFMVLKSKAHICFVIRKTGFLNYISCAIRY